MAVSNEEINAYLAANPGMSDADIAAAMNQYGVSTSQMAQATGLGQDALQSRYDAAIAPQAPLYSGLTATSTPDQISQAYSQFAGGAGGDTAANQQQAVSYLQSLGISDPTITSAYDRFLGKGDVARGLTSSVVEEEIDPYVYAYEYGTANNDFSGLLDLLKQTPDSTQLISKYGLTPEQINQIEFGTGFDLDQSGAYGAGQTKSDWDYGKYYSNLKTGVSDVDELKSFLDPLKTQNPLLANRAQSIFDEILAQQEAGTAEMWSGGNFGTRQGAALDTALRLAETGVSSLSEIGQRTVEPVYDPSSEEYRVPYVEYFNKTTGEKLQNWDNLSQGNNSGSKLNYQLGFTDDGQAIPYTTGKRSGWVEFRDDTLKPAASLFGSFIPGAAPYIAAANAANAASKGDWGTALVSALTAVPGFNSVLKFSPETLSTLSTAKTAGQVLNAIDKKNPIALANTLMQTDVGKELMLQDMGGGITMGDVLNTAKIAQLANTGQYSEALATAGELTNSPNLRVAASAVNFGEAIRTGDPFRIISAVGQLDRATKSVDKTTGTGDLGNRVYDDTITQAGADAFLRAKEAGASDEDAMAASSAATGVVINKIPDAGPSNAVSVTYGQGGVDTNFGDLEGAIATNAINDATRAQRLDEISNQPRFADAYSQARSLLGPNQTFTWNGKQYSTATAQERPDLSAPAVQPATNESAAETARLARQNTALITGNAPDQSAAETARLASLNAGLKSMEKTSFLGQIYKDLNNQLNLNGIAANEFLKSNPNSPITQSVSSAFEAAGELSRNMGGAALALDNKPLADIIIKGGERLQGMGQSIGSGPEDTKNWKDTVDLIDKAKGTEKLAVLAGRVMDGTSGLARQVGLELRQEIPALFLGGGLLKPTLIASGLIDTADTGGAAVVDAYDDVIKKGGTHQQGLDAGRKAGAAAAATEAAIQLTLGKLADFGAGKLDNLISKGTAKVAGEGVVEGSQEAGASAAVDLALGNAIDINKALTQGVLGAAVGKGTATATSGVDAAQTDVANQNASTAGSAGATATDLGSVGATVPGAGAATSTNLGEIGSVTPGGDATVGAQGTISVADAEQTMADLGLNVSGDAAVSLAAKIQEAANSGNDVSFSSDANIVTINDATANTKTTVDANTGTTTVFDANANTTSQTTVDGNTQTTVVTDLNTNTQTTVKINTNTGDVIDVKEAEIPADWKPPVIEPPKIPEVPVATPPGTPAKPPVLEVPKLNQLEEQRRPSGGSGLPSTIDIGGEGLRSRVTQGQIDPLARVKEAQAELEREVMMNQIDPRLMSVMQQRMDPHQQTKQFDSDIGALAKLLGGNKEAPANEGKYYSYGAEDSIDDILGGRAANYKEGGFVEPLKATGGVMALPLMAKSGGALGKYNGREDFKDGKHVAGKGDGQSDDIPAWLADGEFVFPADVVSALGNGSTKAGTDKLYEMMHSIRDRARSKGPKDLPPPALKSPLDYLKSSKRSTK